jgi:glutaredoxin-related protein
MKNLAMIALVLSFVSFAPAATPTVISQSVGQVGGRVVTSREVQISAVLDRILFPTKDAKTAGVIHEVRLGDAGMMNEVTALLLEVVVDREAESFSVAKVSDEEVEQSLRKIEKAVEGKAYWQSLEVSSSELKKFVLQKLTAKAFIQFKTNSMVGVISDAEALAYYEKNRLKFGDMPFATFKENIKTFLAQQQLEERTRAWFEIIRRKYKVRNILAENLNNKVGPR